MASQKREDSTFSPSEGDDHDYDYDYDYDHDYDNGNSEEKQMIKFRTISGVDDHNLDNYDFMIIIQCQEPKNSLQRPL